jgi:antitoxin component HigA of HigAB toxin-antitoxin module
MGNGIHTFYDIKQNDNYLSLIQSVEILRQKKGFTNQQLDEVIGSEKAYNSVKKGKKGLTMSQFIDILEIMEATFDELLFESQNGGLHPEIKG